MPPNKRLPKSDPKRILKEQTEEIKWHNSVSATESPIVTASLTVTSTSGTVVNSKPRRNIKKSNGVKSNDKSLEAPTSETVRSRKSKRNITKSCALDNICKSPEESVTEASTSERFGNSKPRRNITKSSAVKDSCKTPKANVLKASTAKTVGSSKLRRNVKKSIAGINNYETPQASTSKTVGTPQASTSKTVGTPQASTTKTVGTPQASTAKIVGNNKPRRNIMKSSVATDNYKTPISHHSQKKTKVPKIRITESSPKITSAEHTRYSMDEEQMEESEKDNSSALLSAISSPSGTNTNRKRKESPKKLKTPTPKRKSGFRMSIPKDWDSRAELEETPTRSDGLDPEILDYYLNKAYKSTPLYLDLKAKKFNSSFRREYHRRHEIEIFTPEEEAQFAEEERRLYGDQRHNEAESIASANRFVEYLTILEQKYGNEYDKAFEEYDKKIQEEIKESKKQAKLDNQIKKEKKKNKPPAKDTGIFWWENVLDQADLDEMPKHPTIEKKEDLLARWQAEVEARKKKSTSVSNSEEPVAGPSYLSSFDPSLEDNAVMSTPKPNKKKSSMKKTEKVSKKTEKVSKKTEKVSKKIEKVSKKGKKKLASNKVPKKKTEQKK